jgi:hypothetical protein
VTFGPTDRVKFAKAALAVCDDPSGTPPPVPAKRLITIDPDDPDSIARGWETYKNVAAIRNADPETRQDIVRLLPYLAPEVRAEIERVIDDVPPITILREPGLFAALVTANHRGCSSGCTARSEAGRVA